MNVEEVVGKGVSDDQARLRGPEIGGLGRVVPDGDSPFLDVNLRKREGGEFHVPRRSGPQCGHQMLVGVAGKWTAVVIGNGEGSRVHLLVNAGRHRDIPSGSLAPSDRHEYGSKTPEQDTEAPGVSRPGRLVRPSSPR